MAPGNQDLVLWAITALEVGPGPGPEVAGLAPDAFVTSAHGSRDDVRVRRGTRSSA